MNFLNLGKLKVTRVSRPLPKASEAVNSCRRAVLWPTDLLGEDSMIHQDDFKLCRELQGSSFHEL